MNKENVLSKETLLRINKAIEIFNTREIKIIITSGWAYRPDSSKDIGKVVSDYIIETFELKNCLILFDTNSRDTVGDAFFLRQKLLKYKITKLYVVTSDYHVPRTNFIFNSFFPKSIHIEIVGAKTSLANNIKLRHKEENSLKAFKKTFGNINLQNYSDTFKTFRTHHPFYNGETYPVI